MIPSGCSWDQRQKQEHKISPGRFFNTTNIRCCIWSLQTNRLLHQMVTVSQTLAVMLLGKPRGWHICAQEETQPCAAPPCLGNTHRGQTHGTASRLPLEITLMCLSKDHLYTKILYNSGLKKETNSSLLVQLPDSANRSRPPRPSPRPLLTTA